MHCAYTAASSTRCRWCSRDANTPSSSTWTTPSRPTSTPSSCSIWSRRAPSRSARHTRRAGRGALPSCFPELLTRGALVTTPVILYLVFFLTLTHRHGRLRKKKSSSSVRPSSVPLAENIMYVWLSYRTPKGYYIPGRLISYYGEHNMNVSWNRSDQNRVCCVNIESREISWILGPMCG